MDINQGGCSILGACQDKEDEKEKAFIEDQVSISNATTIYHAAARLAVT
jgi:hypothetical protein